MKATAFASLILFTAVSMEAIAQPKPANQDESKVPQYTLPDPLKLENGQKVSDSQTWRSKRRPELMKLGEPEKA